MRQNRPTEYYWSLAPAAGLLLVAFLRFLYLGSNDVAMDEPFTVFFAQADLPVLFRMLQEENNPPLFFLLMHFWIKWFGISPVAIRLLPCLFSILTAVMLYKTGKTFITREAGFFAAGLFALSDYHQLFAHEARVYALFTLLAVASMYLFMALASRFEKRRYTVLLTVVNVLLVYSHFFGFFIFLIQGLSVLIIPEYRKTILKYYAQSVAISCIAYIPYFPVFFSRFFRSAVGGTWVEPPVISDLYTMVWRYLNAPVVTVAVLCILAGALVKFITGIRRGNSFHRHTQLVLVIWFLVPYLIMFLVSFKIPMFLDRYTVFISVGFYLLVSMALNYLVPGTKPGMILMSVFLIMMAVTFHPRADNKRRLKETVHFISDHKGGQTRVVICPQWLEYGFAYHYDKLIFSDYKYLRNRLNREGVYPVNDLSFLDTNNLSHADQVLYFEEWSSLTDPGQSLLQYLGREFRFRQTVEFYEHFKVHIYRKKEKAAS